MSHEGAAKGRPDRTVGARSVRRGQNRTGELFGEFPGAADFIIIQKLRTISQMPLAEHTQILQLRMFAVSFYSFLEQVGAFFRRIPASDDQADFFPAQSDGPRWSP